MPEDYMRLLAHREQREKERALRQKKQEKRERRLKQLNKVCPQCQYWSQNWTHRSESYERSLRPR